MMRRSITDCSHDIIIAETHLDQTVRNIKQQDEITIKKRRIGIACFKRQ